MKFDYDRPTGLRDIHVWKCERTHAVTPARVPSYKLTESVRLSRARNSIYYDWPHTDWFLVLSFINMIQPINGQN